MSAVKRNGGEWRLMYSSVPLCGYGHITAFAIKSGQYDWTYCRDKSDDRFSEAIR